MNAIPQLDDGDVALRSQPMPQSSLAYQFRTLDLHDIVSDPLNRSRLLPTLDHFIWSQAALHHAEYQGTQASLADNLERRGNTLRGVLIYSKDKLPIAYSVYYPMVNGKGERGNYIEDAFVAEAFRGHGVMPIVFHELAKRCVDEGAQFLQWSTDKRNHPFQRLAARMGAFPAKVSTIVVTNMLSSDFAPEAGLQNAWNQAKFVTVPIVGSHVNIMKSIGITPDIIRKTGDIDFRGFVTFRAEDMTKPVAVTPGWPHMSTFRQQHGLYLEEPMFRDDLSAEDRDVVVLSCARAAQTYAHEHNYTYFKWHLTKGESASNLIRERMGFEVDTMVDTPESEMEVYTLENGKLIALSQAQHTNVVHIPATTFGNPSRP